MFSDSTGFPRQAKYSDRVILMEELNANNFCVSSESIHLWVSFWWAIGRFFKS